MKKLLYLITIILIMLITSGKIYADSDNKVYSVVYTQKTEVGHPTNVELKYNVNTTDDVLKSLYDSIQKYAHKVELITTLEMESYNVRNLFNDSYFLPSGIDIQRMEIKKTDSGFIVYFYYSTSRHQLLEVDEFVEKWVKENIKPDMTDEEKVKVIFDYIKNNYKYYYEQEGENGGIRHSIVSTVKYQNGVCSSFSGLFEKLGKVSGLDIISVYGYVSDTRHAWNRVTLNGKNFYFDVTFDMNGTLNRYMKTENEFIEMGYELNPVFNKLLP